MSEYLLPALPLGGERATVVRWLKRPGEPVAAGDPLLVVVSDRAEVALPARVEGIFEQPLVAEGATATVGAALTRITLLAPPALSDPDAGLPWGGATVA